MTAKAAKTSDTMKTAVVGGDRFISPLPLVDERTVIVFSQKASDIAGWEGHPRGLAAA